jgi:DNA-binding NarL/FixJ family response regulator
VLAEDSYLMREGMVRLIETDPDIEVVATSDGLESLMTAVNRHRPDVVVTDIRMPPTHTDEGLQAAEALRDTHPGLGVVLLSQYDEPEYAVKLLVRGAAGRAYLLKDRLFDPADLVNAIKGGRCRPFGDRRTGGRRPGEISEPLRYLTTSAAQPARDRCALPDDGGKEQ